MIKYLIRLDDACPTMEHEKWSRMELLLDKFSIRPMVGVIPNNSDPEQFYSSPSQDFWKQVIKWEKKGWTVAMHGDNHILGSEEYGINPVWKKSEFAGLPLDEQKSKIRSGWETFLKHDVHPKYFFAPCHTFDENTLVALKEETPIRIISDTIALRPYRKGEFIFIPQIGGMARNMKVPGIYTFCFHPSTMKDADFKLLETFLKENKDKFLHFGELDLNNVSSKTVVDKIISRLYFLYRKLKGKK